MKGNNQTAWGGNQIITRETINRADPKNKGVPAARAALMLSVILMGFPSRGDHAIAFVIFLKAVLYLVMMSLDTQNSKT